MCTVRSTGVPVRASTPTTVKGLSRMLGASSSPLPWASVMLLARRDSRARSATSAPITASNTFANGLPSRTPAAAVAVAEMLEVRRRGAEHREAAMRVAERQRHRPGDHRMRGHACTLFHCMLFVAAPMRNTEYSSSCTGLVRAPTIEVGARHRLREALARIAPHAIHAEQQRDAQRDRGERDARA